MADDNEKNNYQYPRSIYNMRVAIFDWDDTIFPTFEKYKKPRHLSLKELHRHGVMIYRTLRRYVKLCGHRNVYIVTNASKGWVNKSLADMCREYSFKLQQKQRQYTHDAMDAEIKKNHFEMVHRLLFDPKFGFPITVMSAQHCYKAFHMSSSSAPAAAAVDTIQWKLFTFQLLLDGKLRAFDYRQYRVDLQILSVGDGFDEYRASLATKQWLQSTTWKHLVDNVFCHRVKLGDKPSLHTMHNQLQLIHDHIPNCFTVSANRDHAANVDETEWDIICEGNDYGVKKQTKQIKQIKHGKHQQADPVAQRRSLFNVDDTNTESDDTNTDDDENNLY
eukprot:CAMPEP_0202694180 /NCGR_PEP_ID=MMETSP1385-20130828/8100_1 /ASSEMBLY_ACC=CAM_ASM_000861 /TAXON_ID=933848 /ORGANISM="Elphidium margaritaceum" /LENGTH=332 /DNA_ID=CAMNT_0049349979 /DNA_START=83 /DNA_END=1081 /DNA_ORIENTATION=-